MILKVHQVSNYVPVTNCYIRIGLYLGTKLAKTRDGNEARE